MSAAIRYDHVTKRYDDNYALRDLSLTVPRGSIFGLVGRNGAGKTTALRILVGLAKATSGSISVFGGDTTRRIGYAPDVPAFYDWLTGREYLEMSAGLASIPSAQRSGRVNELLLRAELGDGTLKIGGYSRGMRQVLGICHALVSKPDLLVLDEPTSALDPASEYQVLEIINSLQGEITIFIASHLMRDIELVADHVAVIESGRIIASGTLDTVRDTGHTGQRIEIQVSDRAQEIAKRLNNESWVKHADAIGSTISVAVSDDVEGAIRIPVIVSEMGVGLEHLEFHEPTLEEAFLVLTENET